jgi:putative membrane protein
MAAMVGLMLGSTRVLWAWPNGTNSTTLGAPRDDVVLPLLLIVSGAALVIGVSQLSRHLAAAEPEKVASSVPS